MEVREALKILNINEWLKQKQAEATQMFIKGLVENGNKINEAIMAIKEFLK